MPLSLSLSLKIYVKSYTLSRKMPAKGILTSHCLSLKMQGEAEQLLSLTMLAQDCQTKENIVSHCLSLWVPVKNELAIVSL